MFSHGNHPFVSGSFINIKLDNKNSPQMVAQILPDKSFVFIFYDKQRKNEQSLLKVGIVFITMCLVISHCAC
jgi:hypothetical protein